MKKPYEAPRLKKLDPIVGRIVELAGEAQELRDTMDRDCATARTAELAMRHVAKLRSLVDDVRKGNGKDMNQAQRSIADEKAEADAAREQLRILMGGEAEILLKDVGLDADTLGRAVPRVVCWMLNRCKEAKDAGHAQGMADGLIMSAARMKIMIDDRKLVLISQRFRHERELVALLESEAQRIRDGGELGG